MEWRRTFSVFLRVEERRVGGQEANADWTVGIILENVGELTPNPVASHLFLVEAEDSQSHRDPPRELAEEQSPRV